MKEHVPKSMTNWIEEINKHFALDEKTQELFSRCFVNTYDTTIRKQKDRSTFVITGDIPAMWLRDSSAQVRPYLLLAEQDPHIADLIEGLILKQCMYINHDPYANAFNEEHNGNRYHEDRTDMTPLIWERKYEVDSLCYPIQLAYLFWKSTGRTTHINKEFLEAIQKILSVWKTEQHHQEKSPYYFERDNCPAQDTLSHQGKGTPVAYTGMTWSGFRPSDDACTYGYLIPSNMFAVVVLRQLHELAKEVVKDERLAAEAVELANEIDQGIQTHGTVHHPTYGTIYAYEVDGLGHVNLMDDANVPSLLSIPYLGYCAFDDPIYLNTRAFILSEENPYYFEGTAAKGIGSPHTPDQYIWHISLAIQGMTTTDQREKDYILSLFKTTDANEGLMHEGFDVNNPEKFTRPWFAWANSMYSEFLLSYCGYAVKGSPLQRSLKSEMNGGSLNESRN